MDEIGLAVKRFDFEEKADGSIRYCADIRMDGMRHAKTLRSTRSRARIRAVEIPPLPDGYLVVDAGDIPGRNVVPIVYEDQPFLASGAVNFIGEPILLVIGPQKEKIQQILDAIIVDYEDLEPVFTIEQAEQKTEDFISGDKPYFADYSYSKGDYDTAAAQAVLVVEDEFRCGYQEQAYLETQSMIGEYEDGRVTVSGSMQCPYYIHAALKQALGLPDDRVRVVQLPTGGGFGGKEDFPSIIGGHAGLAAYKAKCPVKIVYDRREDMICSTKRHPAIIRIRSCIDGKGRIAGREIDVKTDAGAYSGLSGVVLQRLLFSVGNVYNIDNLKVHGTAYATNNVPTGAFRGFGAAQALWAMEMHMENIASRLGVDSLELKRAHFYHIGDTSATGGVFNFDIKLDEIADKIDSLSGYKEKRSKYQEDQGRLAKNSKFRGIGCSMFYHGCGFTGDGEHGILRPKVRLRKYADGKVQIFVSSTEFGQGSFTALRKIVAGVLDIPTDDVVCKFPDTAVCPDSGPTVASRTVMIVGKLLYDASALMKLRWQEESFDIDLEYGYPSYLRWDNDKFEGNAYPEYSWGANVAEVEVDPATNEVTVLGFWAVYDIGVPIDERLARGQIEGGIVQALGYSHMEVMNARGGRLQQSNLTDYIIPTAVDYPRIVSDLVLNPFPDGPFGARGLGELSFVGAAPAVTLALQQATGCEIRRLPATPEYLTEVMGG